MRVYFSKLLGNHYSQEEKMFVLDWMLKTGMPFSRYTSRWGKDGVNKSLFDYSANDMHYKCPIPIKPSQYSWWFDAIFSRAIYRNVPGPVQDWRIKENIFPERYRVLDVNDNVPKIYYDEYKHLPWLINSIYDLQGSMLNKNYHQKGWVERTKPKIIWVRVFTCGGGWRVEYGFSFKEFEYENGWHKGYSQKNNQSLWEFFGETIDDIKSKLTKSQNV